MRQRSLFLLSAVLIGSVLVVIPAGCEKRDKVGDPEPRTESQSGSHPLDRDHPMARQFDRIAESADLADMVICDIHFMPNRSMLNGSGTEKLHKLAWIVNHYGGTINIHLAEPKTKLAKARMTTVRAYLRELGLAENKIQLAFGLPPTKGMRAGEAMLIHVDTRYKPEAAK